MSVAGRATPSRLSRGFSLLEVVVVLALLGLIAVITAPALSGGLTGDELDSSAQEVATLIQRARRTALEHGAPVTLVIDPEAARYWVYANAGNGERLLSSGSLALKDGARLVARLPRARFVFQPSGEAVADNVAIRRGSVTVPIVVNAWSGEVQVDSR